MICLSSSEYFFEIIFYRTFAANFLQMKKITFLFIMALALVPFFSSAQSDDVWTQRANEIVKGANTQYEKAKAIFDWQARNISYDVSFTIRDAEQAWKQRKGVCAGYSKMFVQLATHCGLEAKEISGKSRNIHYPKGDGDHAWVKVNTEKGWILLDPTWGAGNVTNGKFEFKYKPYWFDVDPWWMLFSHYPDNREDQLLPQPLPKSVYDQMPDLTPDLAWWGWNGEKTFKYYWAMPGQEAPKAYLFPDEWRSVLQVDEVPFYGELKVNYQYSFKMHSSGENYTFGITGTAGKDIFGDFTSGAFIVPKSAGTLVISIYEKSTNRIYDVLVYKVVAK